MIDSDYIFEVTSDNFVQVVLEGSKRVPVLVDLWAEWCQPCKTLMPILAKLAEEYQGKFMLAKINTEEQQELAAQFQVRSIPAVRLFKDGQAVDEFMGALPESEVRAFLDRHIPKESDSLIDQATQLVKQGQIDDAVSMVEQARQSDPNNPHTIITSARLKATLGKIDEAEQELDLLPTDQQQDPEVLAIRARLIFDRIASDAPDIISLGRLLEADNKNSEARYQLAARLVVEGDYQEALEQLLWIMQNDRKYEDDAARKAMLNIFEILGSENPLANSYRSRMFAILH